MTLDKKLSKQIYKSNGNAIDFPFSFKVFEKDYISVTINNDNDPLANNELLEILPEDISLSENGGSVKIYYDRIKQSPYPEGYTIAITRNMPFLQLLSLSEGGAFHAKVLENSFDIMKAELQQLYEIIQRAVIVPVTSEEDPSLLLRNLFEAERNILLVNDNIHAQAETITVQAINSVLQAENARKWAVAGIDENPEGSAKYWAENISSGLPEATVLQKGIVQRASDEIAEQGQNETAYINAKQLIANIQKATPEATIEQKGLLRKASDEEIIAGISEEGAISPKQYKENLPLAFESGTRMLFQQSFAPSGWTKEIDSNYNDIAIKIVTGDVSVEGSINFNDLFVQNKNLSVSGTVGNTTLSVAQLPSHKHSLSFAYSLNNGSYNSFNHRSNETTPTQTGDAGSNHAHTHSFSGASVLDLSLKRCSVIICTKL